MLKKLVSKAGKSLIFPKHFPHQSTVKCRKNYEIIVKFTINRKIYMIFPKIP